MCKRISTFRIQTIPSFTYFSKFHFTLVQRRITKFPSYHIFEYDCIPSIYHRRARSRGTDVCLSRLTFEEYVTSRQIFTWIGPGKNQIFFVDSWRQIRLGLKNLLVSWHRMVLYSKHYLLPKWEVHFTCWWKSKCALCSGFPSMPISFKLSETLSTVRKFDIWKLQIREIVH